YRSRKNKRNKHRFNAGLMLGNSMSQLDGDDFTGFDKSGIRGGLKGMIFLNDKLDITAGLLFNQKGSRFENPNLNAVRSDKNRIIHLDYMEVPLLLTIKQLKKNAQGYRFDLGVSFARLINYNITEIVPSGKDAISFEALSSSFNSNEFSIVGGVSYFFTPRMGLGLHYTAQMNKVYDNPDKMPTPDFNILSPASAIRKKQVDLLRNFQLGIFLTYHIF
ncbi:MAG: porin family protein, partial [Bacteroidota bacterium]